MAEYEVDFTINSNEIEADFELEENEVEAQFVLNTGSGGVYVFADGLTETNNRVTLNKSTTTSIGGIITGSNLTVDANGTLSVANASNTTKGVIRIATDAEAQAQVLENVAVNPKQLQRAAVITDEVTVSKTPLNELKTIGTYTQNGVLKYDWIGTKAEYNTAWAAEEIDPTWFCIITDNTESISILRNNNPVALRKVDTANAPVQGSTLPITSDGVYNSLQTKQDNLISGTNIKTINNTSLLGSGNIEVSSEWGNITGDITSQTDLQTQLSSKLSNADKGVAGGVASLNLNGKIPLTQISDSLLGNVSYQGLWDASTNTPTLPEIPSGIKGHYYIVQVAGTKFGISFQVGDWIIAGSDSWQKVNNTDAVSSVQGRTGNVVINLNDLGVTATNTELNKLSGAIVSTTEINNLAGSTGSIQAQINEKQPKLTAGNNIQITNNTISATDTTYTAGTGIAITGNVISNTQTSAEWGNITGDMSNQVDLKAALDNKVTKNQNITPGSAAKVIYDAKGLVTGSTNLEETDIPNIHLNKITDVIVPATNVNYLFGTTGNIQDQLDAKQGTLTAGAGISIDANNVITNTRTSAAWGNITGSLDNQVDLTEEFERHGSSLEYSGSTISLKNTNDDTISSIDIGQIDLRGYYTKEEIDSLLNNKQTTLIAGDNITIIDNVISSTGGGGPVTPNFTLETITPAIITVAYGASTTLQYTYTSTKNLRANVQYSVNNALKATQIIPGTSTVSFDIGPYLSEGSNHVEALVTDVYGFSMTLTYEITAVALTMSSSFDSSLYYNQDITFRYTPTGAVTKTIHFVLDGVDTTEIVSTSGRELTKTLSNLTYGAHSFEVYATATIGSTSIESNRLFYNIMYTGGTATGPFIASEFTGTTFRQGEIVQVPFNVYTPDSLVSTVTVYLNNTAVATMQVDRTRQTWSKNLTTIGTNTIKLVSGTAEKTFTVTVTEVQIDVHAVTEHLDLYLDAVGRSNSDVNRDQWTYGDLACTLSNFNFVNNGWIDNALLISNGASLTIPLQIFSQDCKQTGKTIEIEFKTANIADYDSIVGSCLSGNRGFQIGVQSAFLKSEQSEIKARFKEDEHIRLSFVIEAKTAHRLIYTYLNGILSGIVQYPDDDDFSQITPVNITFGSTTTDIHIYKIRVYSNYLSRTEMLNNWIADTNDINEKISRYTRNDIFDTYGAISYNKVLNQVPIMIITGELPPTKGDKKKVTVQYQNLSDPSRDFTMNNVTLDIQGTSSQYYPKKNYKISKLPTAYKLRSTSIEEKVFTLKADYMESSHAHNTGLGKFVASLYTDKTPPQVSSSSVRTTIDGFPMAMYYRASSNLTPNYFGVYNFNNDKESNNTWGFTTGCESWGVENNTSARCLFQSADFSDIEAVLTDFEPRYPADYTNVSNLHALVSWVVGLNPATATGAAITPVVIGGVTYDHDTAAYRIAKFKDECEDHFNLNYLLTYYIVGEFFGMVDSFAKNLFLNMYTNGIWYPVFYDMDTQVGLNNEGVNEFNFNIEFHDQIGTSKVFNGESSVLWKLVEGAFPDELSTLYQTLRSDNKLTYDKVMAVYEGEQISKICEAQYNEDAQFKYLDPLFNEGTATYLYTAQGSRIDHIKWWLSSRFKYMDSKYIASDYRANYLTMRIYTPQTWQEVQPDAKITVTPYADQYVRIKYGSYTVGGRAEHDTPYVVNPPAGITFNDTETIIYGADKITSIGDISSTYCGTVDVSKAVKLSELIIGHGGNYSNTNLRSLTLGNNTLLRTLDIRNCPNLTGALDVSGCTSIEDIDASGTSLTSVKLPNAGSLTSYVLPNTITNLTVKNQNSIETFSCGYTNISTLVLENTNLDSKTIFSSCTNLTKVRLINVDWTLGNSFALLDRAYNMLGLDESGFNTDHGVVTGIVRMSNVRDSEVNIYRAKFPNINFIVNPYTPEDYVCDDFGNIITTSEGYPLLYVNV